MSTGATGLDATTGPRIAGARRITGGGWSWRRQLGLFAAAYAVYNLGRWVFVGDLSEARTHAEWIIDLEQAAGVAVEDSVQGALDSDIARWFFSNVYMAAQLVVLPGSLVWLYRRSPEIYRGLRNTILATWLIAVPIYALFPVAPPRLADLGIADTVSEQTGFALTGRSTIFYNPLAAVPSLHVGFAVAIGVALALALRARWAKALALLWGPLVGLAVVATGNHYVFDILAGLAVTAAGFYIGRLPGRRRTPGDQRARLPAVLRGERSGRRSDRVGERAVNPGIVDDERVDAERRQPPRLANSTDVPDVDLAPGGMRGLNQVRRREGAVDGDCLGEAAANGGGDRRGHVVPGGAQSGGRRVAGPLERPRSPCGRLRVAEPAQRADQSCADEGPRR
jgi:membrane-associated phospholipid phosphatase